MGTKDITVKTMKLLLMELEKQGCVIVDKKSGYQIRFPNGDSTSFHNSPSDVRAIHNMRSRVRRAGLRWPLDPKGN